MIYSAGTLRPAPGDYLFALIHSNSAIEELASHIVLEPDIDEGFTIATAWAYAERNLLASCIGFLHYRYVDQPQYQSFAAVSKLLDLVGGDVSNPSAPPLDALILGSDGTDEEVKSYKRWAVDGFGKSCDQLAVVDWYRNFKKLCGGYDWEGSVADLVLDSLLLGGYLLDDVEDSPSFDFSSLTSLEG